MHVLSIPAEDPDAAGAFSEPHNHTMFREEGNEDLSFVMHRLHSETMCSTNSCPLSYSSSTNRELIIETAPNNNS
ncbi:MAG TPA: hypothetical protein VEL11_07950 [Candidatus Bathyarchaeia archaeon]|nr:hypothetical protein [Candidatus Bathyarchaeia archaeon]